MIFVSIADSTKIANDSNSKDFSKTYHYSDAGDIYLGSVVTAQFTLTTTVEFDFGDVLKYNYIDRGYVVEKKKDGIWFNYTINGLLSQHINDTYTVTGATVQAAIENLCTQLGVTFYNHGAANLSVTINYNETKTLKEILDEFAQITASQVWLGAFGSDYGLHFCLFSWGSSTSIDITRTFTRDNTFSIDCEQYTVPAVDNIIMKQYADSTTSYSKTTGTNPIIILTKYASQTLVNNISYWGINYTPCTLRGKANEMTHALYRAFKFEDMDGNTKYGWIYDYTYSPRGVEISCYGYQNRLTPQVTTKQVNEKNKETNAALSSKVSFSDLSTSGSTTINGANITLGQVSWDKVTHSGLAGATRADSILSAQFGNYQANIAPYEIQIKDGTSSEMDLRSSQFVMKENGNEKVKILNNGLYFNGSLKYPSSGVFEEGTGYIKFKDGTLICYGMKNLTNITFGGGFGSGGLYYCTLTNIDTFAQIFTTAPEVFINIRNYGTDSSCNAFPIKTVPTTTTFSTYIASAPSSTTTKYRLIFSWCAIGRWS